MPNPLSCSTLIKNLVARREGREREEVETKITALQDKDCKGEKRLIIRENRLL